jgi:hypothetical protein
MLKGGTMCVLGKEVLPIALLICVFGGVACQSPARQEPHGPGLSISQAEEELRAENTKLKTELRKAQAGAGDRKAEEESTTARPSAAVSDRAVKESDVSGQTQATEPTRTANSDATVPPHQVNETWKRPWKPGVTAWLFLVVKPDLSESDAWAIINYYDRQYSKDSILNIDMFCGTPYATHKSIDDPKISDQEYYRHVLYSFMRGPYERSFNSPSHPAYEGQGSECRRDAGL